MPNQEEVENKFKQVVNRLRLPALPTPPANMLGASDETKQLWELNERVKGLEARYALILKVVWRTSAGVVGGAATLFGWDAVLAFLKFLGV
jgi:hypothetical protein